MPQSDTVVSWKLLRNGDDKKFDIERQGVTLSMLRLVLREVSLEHNRSVEAFHKAERENGKKEGQIPNTAGHIIMSGLIQGTNKDLSAVENAWMRRNKAKEIQEKWWGKGR